MPLFPPAPLYLRSLLPAVAIGLALAAPSSADVTQNLDGAKLKQAEHRLSKGGYTRVESAGRKQLWWSKDDKTCVLLKIDGDHVGDARTVDRQRCKDARHDSGGGSGHGSDHGSSLSGLNGMRASSLDAEMKSRGYRNKGGHKDDNTAYTTWWNHSTRECVSIGVRDGHVRKVESIVEGNCL